MPGPRLSHGAVHAVQSFDGDHDSVAHGCVLHVDAIAGSGRLSCWQYRGGTRMPVMVAQKTDLVVTPLPHITLQALQGPVTHWCNCGVDGDGDIDAVGESDAGGVTESDDDTDFDSDDDTDAVLVLLLLAVSVSDVVPVVDVDDEIDGDGDATPDAVCDAVRLVVLVSVIVTLRVIDTVAVPVVDSERERERVRD